MSRKMRIMSTEELTAIEERGRVTVEQVARMGWSLKEDRAVILELARLVVGVTEESLARGYFNGEGQVAGQDRAELVGRVINEAYRRVRLKRDGPPRRRRA